MIVHSFIERLLLLVKYQEVNWKNHKQGTFGHNVTYGHRFLWMIKFTQPQGELNWMFSWRKHPFWAVQDAAASSGEQWRKGSRSWGTCPLLKLFIGTAMSSRWRINTRWDGFPYFLKVVSKRKITFWKSKCFISPCQLKSDLFYNWVNFSLQKTLKKGFISQQMKHSAFSSSVFLGIFFSPFGKQNWHFCFGVTWNFSFSFLTPQNWLYSCSCPWEKSCLFFPCYQICY